jgi:predicted AlkP superfamily pyrophosphatase or phosphodiesterase
MRFSSLRRLLLALSFFLTVLHGKIVIGEQSVRHVVLVSVDGLAASYLHDERAELPTLRALASQGASAQGMITSFPSVTWPSHVSLMTGTHPARHGVIGNSVYDRTLGRPLVYIGDPELIKSEAVQVPTLYDAAHDEGLQTAAVIWPCSSGASTLDYVIPDSNKAELHARFTTPALYSLLDKKGIDIRPLAGWGWSKERSSERDQLYTQVTCQLLQAKKVNLILLHLIKPDGVEHAYGPHTPEAYAAVQEADGHIQTIWNALNQPPFAGRSALFVVSDHGFAPYEKIIQPNVVLERLGLIELHADKKVKERKAWCVAQGGSAFIYVLESEGRDQRLAQLREEFESLEGVAEVIGDERFEELGLPLPHNNRQAPDLVLATGPGYSFSDGLDGEAVVSAGGRKGSHGHLPQPDYMHALFVAAGTGIREGVELEQVNNIDVAPTIARLMGLDLPDAEGRVLVEILQSQ